MSRAIPAPPATIAAPTPHITTPGGTFAAQRITTGGPTTYDSSPCTDSSANAARRCPAVVIAAIACRVTSWAGTISRTGRALTGHCGVGLLEDLAASQLPQALADLARLHPGATLEVLSLPSAVQREAYDACRVQLVLDEVLYLPGSPRWTVRRPLAWAVGQGVGITADPLPVVLFSGMCTWRTSVLEALERADRHWRVAFESNSLAGVLAGLRAGLGVSALLPANLEPAMACHEADALPTLPDVELGLARHSRTEGDPLIDAVETALRRMI